MVTSTAHRTPSLFLSFLRPSTSSSSSSSSSSASLATLVGAVTVIAFLLLTSIDQAISSPTHEFHHHRNISASSSIHQDLPSSSSSNPAASAADPHQSLHLILRHGKARRASGSGDGTPSIICYSCTYIMEEDYTAGSECNDPFNSANIPELTCPGSCHKLKKKLHQGGVMLVRGCLKSCKEKVDEHGYRHCCTSNKCNSAFSLNSINNSIKILCSTVLCLFLAARLNSFV